MTPTTILVVDDEPSWRVLLRRVFEVDGYSIAVAADGAEALAAVRAAPPSLILLDDVMPGLEGVEVCARLRRDERGKHIPIIMLTVRDDTANRVSALEAGADDYVAKPCDFDELRARVRARLRRQTAAPPLGGSLRIDPTARQATLENQPLPLSRREFDLLALLWGEAGRLVARDTIAREVWGGTIVPKDNVIEVYVRRLRRKLRAAGFTGRVRTRWGGGYLLELCNDATAPPAL